MKIGIIGAGIAGLTTAKVLKQAGHDVVVFDKAPDVGGVWSRTRRYPGVSTQSPKAQYSLSDFPMPKDYPEWPSGPQVQAYLESYAAHFGLLPHLRMCTEVTRARPTEDGWAVDFHGTDGTTDTADFDRLVVANGIFCEPAVPEYPGLEEFTAVGGRLWAGTEFHDAEVAVDKHVLVVGYGKSACDVAVPISRVAASTDVIARHVLWKIPRKIGGFLNFKMLLMTRLGEALFRYMRLRGLEKFLHGPGDGLRQLMLNSLGPSSIRQYRLKKLNLVPPGRMEDIVKGPIGLGTEGFFEGVADGTITVRRDRTIARLLADGNRSCAELSDGTVLPADLVICATGFRQGVPFLDEEVQRRLLDDRGNFMLYRQILPVDQPGLYFNGYNSSFFSQLNAEMAALWIAADLAGFLSLPDPQTRRKRVTDQIAFMDDATGRHHCRGTKVIPFSVRNVDEVLDDLGLNISPLIRAVHWLKPVDPAAYRDVTGKLIELLGQQRPPDRRPHSSLESDIAGKDWLGGQSDVA
ncbi:flavin-containing monooxygenase [Streptomyces chartreusis]|uniref:flavin-containing monooxygenase n=1 Tax=Streptomyces chartreusis TaxID=1969 RepID=UPI0036773449